MNKFVLWLILWIGILFASPALAANVFEIDPVHSSFVFSVQAAMISQVYGGFSSSSGTITYDPNDVTSFEAKVTIEVVDINTFHRQRDDVLKGQDFFDIQNFPEITFVSKSLDNNNVIVGDLTIRGVTREVSIPVSISGPHVAPGNRGTALAIIGQLAIKRSDYGMTWNFNLGDEKVFLVGEDVQLYISILAMKN